MAAILNNKIFIPTAPIKGSFPIDHEGQCKDTMVAYMTCMRSRDTRNDKCREQAKKYFQCRMDHNLMDKEDWQQLGYGDLPSDSPK